MYSHQILSNLGQALKEAREDQGLTLKQVAEKTKINKYTLQAIEEAKVEELPVYTYLRGFILTYARELEMDLKAIEKSLVSLVNKSETTYPNITVSSTEAENLIEKDIKLTPIIIAIGILFVVGCIVIFTNIVQSYKEESIKAVTEFTEDEEEVIKEEMPAVEQTPKKQKEKVVSKEVVEKQEENSDETETETETETDTEAEPEIEIETEMEVETKKSPPNLAIELIVKAHGEVRVLIQSDLLEKQELSLKKDQFKVINAEEQILVQTEDASLISIFKNGKNLGIFGAKGPKEASFSIED